MVDERAVRNALAAHLCRCTGFQPIVEAALGALGDAALPPPRDRAMAAARASLESGTAQDAGPGVVRGLAPFADDTAPPTAVAALATSASGYELAATWVSARRASGVRQGRNSTVALRHPVALPDGAFDLVLQTTWVEPAYLEPDASWCAPGGAPAAVAANAGDFGAKGCSTVGDDVAALAAVRGEAVRARWTREAVVLRGAKRPPLALGLHADGTGAVVLGWTSGSAGLDHVVEAMRAVAPGVRVDVAEVVGPRVGARTEARGWPSCSPRSRCSTRRPTARARWPRVARAPQWRSVTAPSRSPSTRGIPCARRRRGAS